MDHNRDLKHEGELALECKDVIQDVICKIKAVKGVEEAYILNEKDKEKIFELEKKAEGAVLMGLGVGDNQGIKEVFKRQIIIAFTTNMDYVWPEGSNVFLMQYGEKIGEDIYDPQKLEECKKCKDMIVMGNFVIYRSAVPKPKDAEKEPITVVLPPRKCQEAECVNGVINAVLASPSTPSDEYIRSSNGHKAGNRTRNFSNWI